MVHRENKYEDYYGSVHYGSIDVILEPSDDPLLSTSSPNKPFKPYLLFSIWNHFNEVVIQKTVPIHPPFSSDSLKLLQDLSTYDYNSVKGKNLVTESNCEVFWGPAKLTDYFLFFFIMTLYFLILFSIPLSIILWFFGKNIFSLLFGRKQRRID